MAAKYPKAITSGGYVNNYKKYINVEDKDLYQGGFKSQEYRDNIVTRFKAVFGTDRGDAIGVS